MNIGYKKGSLILLSGLPGSGKSTFIKKHFNNELQNYIISSDEIRERYFGSSLDYDENGIFKSLIQENGDTIFQVMQTIAKNKLELGQTCVIDATLLKDRDRNAFINLGQWKEIHLLIFDIDLETILLQNNDRRFKNNERFVSSNVIEAKFDKFQKNTQNKNVFTHYITKENRDNIVFAETFSTINTNDYDNVFILGDTHGSPYLESIYKKLSYEYEGLNKIIFCGDIVDKGPNSFENFMFLYDLKINNKADISFIMGNHDYKLMQNLKSYLELGFIDYDKIKGYYLETLETFIERLNNNQLINIINFIETYFEDFIILEDKYNIKNKTDKYLITHAPFLPPAHLGNINQMDCIFGSSRFRKLYQAGNLNESFIQSLYTYIDISDLSGFINGHIDYSDMLHPIEYGIANLDGSVEYNGNVCILHFNKNNIIENNINNRKQKLIKIPSGININKRL